MQDFIQLAGTDDRVFPVSVIQLDLDKLYFRMGIQHLYQISRASVEGKTEMPDFAFRLLFQSPIETVQALIGFSVTAVLDGMEEIEIKIVHAAPFQLFTENTVPVFRSFQNPGGQLCRQHKPIPGIALHKGFLYGLLGIAAMIDISGIEVVHARLHIGIDHTVHMVYVDGSVFLGQAHKAEPQLGHGIQINAHSMKLLSKK